MNPGSIALISSGETTSSGGLVFDALAQGRPSPLRIAMLETPAGFEPNSDRVLEKVSMFLEQRLQNFKPLLTAIHARRREGAAGTDDPATGAQVFGADLIYLGAGSPSYTVRHLAESWLWWAVMARLDMGAGVAMASAAAVASGALVLPVYEIYKAGHDLHWLPGLDVFGAYGLRLAVLPHWNNNDGGEELDTSRCFMGLERFERLRAMLPENVSVLGIDERTGLTFDTSNGEIRVFGLGAVTVLNAAGETRHAAGATLHAGALGPFHPADPSRIRPDVWSAALSAAETATPNLAPSDEVLALLAARAAARTTRDWARADALRTEIDGLGWRIEDGLSGPRAVPHRVGA
ncbi:MAG: cysteinyl-tRNA synthetase [Thermoflexales bacterium]